MTLSLAETKAAAEAEITFFADEVRWLVERCEELAEALRQCSEVGQTHVQEIVAAALALQAGNR